MGDLFDPSKLMTVPYQEEILGPLSLGYLIVFLAGFITALALSLRPPARLKAHGLRRRFAQRTANLLLWGFGVGLVFFGFRVLGLPFLGWRLWAYVTALAVLAIVGYIVYSIRMEYPKQLAAYEAQQLKRYYQQQTRKRPIGENGRPVARSPRAEKRRARGGTTARGR